MLPVIVLMAASVILPSTRPDTVPRAGLLAGDLLRVEIWREEDLSGEFPVDQNGDVVLPLLGERHVTGIPIEELRQSLLIDYRRELRNPSITITPLRRIYVLGEVNEPGLLTVDPTVSLAGAVALAGGANQQGDLRRIQVIRSGQPVLDGVAPTAALSTLDVRSGDQIFVGRRSWLDRNSTFLVSSVLSITSIVITLLQ
jgi:protein involved in polysaccharide export with SLBB domain